MAAGRSQVPPGVDQLSRGAVQLLLQATLCLGRFPLSLLQLLGPVARDARLSFGNERLGLTGGLASGSVAIPRRISQRCLVRRNQPRKLCFVLGLDLRHVGSVLFLGSTHSCLDSRLDCCILLCVSCRLQALSCSRHLCSNCPGEGGPCRRGGLGNGCVHSTGLCQLSICLGARKCLSMVCAKPRFGLFHQLGHDGMRV